MKRDIEKMLVDLRKTLGNDFYCTIFISNKGMKLVRINFGFDDEVSLYKETNCPTSRKKGRVSRLNYFG